jgi:hypothetical protein
LEDNWKVLGQYFEELDGYHTLFASATKERVAERRALLILKWIIIALKSQFYIGGDPSTSIKKPLNAILGELFLGAGKTKMQRPIL